MKNKKKNWLSLIYIIPWAIGGTLTVPLIAIVVCKHLAAMTPLSYEWMVDIALLLLIVRELPMSLNWIEELEKEGFIEEKKKLKAD